MNSIFKKSAIAIAIIGLSSSAYAGTVTGFFVGAEGLDLQPRNGDLDFVTIFPSGSGPGIFTTDGIHPSYGWGWRVYAGFDFCGGDDLTFSWLRYHTNDHDDFGTPLAPGATTPAVNDVRFLTGSTAWSDIFAEAKFDLDEATLVFAHTAWMGPWSFRFGAGAEWARLDTDLITYANDSAARLWGADAVSDFRGIGPRVELDMAYHMPYNLSVFARTNLALLIGNRDVDLEVAEDVIDPTITGQAAYEFDKHRVIVPKLGIRLGVAYNFNFGAMGGEGATFEGSNFALEAGWTTESYIHAIERPLGFGNTGTTNVNASGNYTTKTSNYGYEGFFIGAKLSTGWFS